MRGTHEEMIRIATDLGVGWGVSSDGPPHEVRRGSIVVLPANGGFNATMYFNFKLLLTVWDTAPQSALLKLKREVSELLCEVSQELARGGLSDL
jgi:hypothetical protein